MSGVGGSTTVDRAGVLGGGDLARAATAASRVDKDGLESDLGGGVGGDGEGVRSSSGSGSDS
jgi:hypothetical protein